jgi:class 3 adenylate cyclase
MATNPEKILTARATLAGERKQVTVLFADLKGSMELLAAPSPPLLPCTAPWT